jgi:hypothetical protein
MLEPAPRGDYSTLEEPTIFDLHVEALRPANTLMTDLSTLILIQVIPPEVTPSESELVLQATMKENVVTSSRSPHTIIMATTAEGMLPPLPPSSVWTIVVLTASTSGSVLILSSMMTTAPFNQSVMGPTFSYGIPDFDSNSFITYSTLHTMGLGEGNSNTLMQGSTRDASIPFNVITYGGGHIPPPSPSLSSSFQQPVRLNANYILFGEGSL